MRQILQNDWHEILHNEFLTPYYLQLRDFLKEEYESQTVYPPMNDIFNALHFTPFSSVKVVILGQDPYHGFGQAHGLSFSVQHGIPLPPSLQNIFKELSSDVGCALPSHGNLEDWAKQGVLLLNTTLTVREGTPASHFRKGWETFTDRIITSLNEKNSSVVFILWGKNAQSKRKLIDTNKHFILESAHPSPLSSYRGFFESKPFSKANKILRNSGQTPINWEIK